MNDYEKFCKLLNVIWKYPIQKRQLILLKVISLGIGEYATRTQRSLASYSVGALQSIIDA
jgi:hypothetical protein